MKKPLLVLLLVLTAAALACRAVPLHLPGLVRSTPTTTPSPTPLPISTPTITPSPAPTAVPSATLPVSTSQPPLDFHDQVSEETVKADQYTLKLRYPELNPDQPQAAAFNQAVKDMIDSWVPQFRKDAAEMAGTIPDSNGSFFGLDYKVFYNQNSLVSLQFSLSTYLQGAAHPNLVSFPLNFDLDARQKIALKDLFQPDSSYLAMLSTLSVADLQKRDFPITLSGAAPSLENYRSWNLTPNALRITFDAYQVAAYAAGPQAVEIPWKVLESLLSPRFSALFLPR